MLSSVVKNLIIQEKKKRTREGIKVELRGSTLKVDKPEKKVPLKAKKSKVKLKNLS